MNVLIIRPDHIGDMLLTTPFLSALRSSFPHWRITVLCGSWSRPILENNPNYDRIVVCDFPWLARDTRASWKTFFTTIFKLQQERFDIIFNVRKAAKEAVVSRFLRGKERWGFDIEKSSWAFNRRIRYRTDIHIADLYLEFVKVIGGTPVHSGLELYFNETEHQTFQRSVTVPERYAVIAPGAGYPEKLWNTERWAEVSDFIIEKIGMPVVFIGSAGERVLVQSIIEKMNKNPYNLTGMLSIRQVAIAIQKAIFIVTVDSAAMHIGSAVRTPVVALFGPTNPVHWGPYPNGRANQVISKVTQFTLGRGSTNPSGGMEDITVSDVKEAIIRLCDAEHIL
jgi:lipopolysaccharide heptosyltransferase II